MVKPAQAKPSQGCVTVVVAALVYRLCEMWSDDKTFHLGLRLWLEHKSVSHSESPALAPSEALYGDIEWLEPLVCGGCVLLAEIFFSAAVDSDVGIWVCSLVRDSKTLYSVDCDIVRESLSVSVVCVCWSRSVYAYICLHKSFWSTMPNCCSFIFPSHPPLPVLASFFSFVCGNRVTLFALY